MSARTSATAFAPASIGNLAVGFDMLGAAIAGPGDRVSVARAPRPGIRIVEIYDPDGRAHATLPRDAERNTAAVAAGALWRDASAAGGLELVLQKGIPLQSGMGSSAASAVAAVVAANALLAEPLEPGALLPYALAGEQEASGGLHADNVAPSLLGGLVLCPPALLPAYVSLTPPRGVSSVLLHPDLQVSTAESRRKLAQTYPIDLWLTQQGYLAAFVAACEQDDPDLLARSLHDVVIEPQRKSAVPVFDAVRDAALAAGALGCSLSGSGPSLFALCPDGRAASVRQAMESACRSGGIDCSSWISPLDAPGARLEKAL